MSKEEGDMSQGKRIPPPKKRQKCKVVFISSPSVRYKVKRGETILKRLASLTAKKKIGFIFVLQYISVGSQDF